VPGGSFLIIAGLAGTKRITSALSFWMSLVMASMIDGQCSSSYIWTLPVYSGARCCRRLENGFRLVLLRMVTTISRVFLMIWYDLLCSLPFLGADGVVEFTQLQKALLAIWQQDLQRPAVSNVADFAQRKSRYRDLRATGL